MATTQERQDLLNEAEQLIIEAKNLIDQAVSGSRIESNYKAYGRYGLDTFLGNGNPHDGSLYTLVESIEEGDCEEDEEY